MLHFTANTTDQMDEDMELQRALQQSLTTITGHARTTTTILFGHYESNCGRCISTSWHDNKSMKKKKNPLNAPAATTQKSDAPKPTVVLARPLRTKSELLSQHHSDVKLIPKLQDKSIEEQILSTVDRETTTSTASNNHVKPTTYPEEVQQQNYYLSQVARNQVKGGVHCCRFTVPIRIPFVVDVRRIALDCG